MFGFLLAKWFLYEALHFTGVVRILIFVLYKKKRKQCGKNRQRVHGERIKLSLRVKRIKNYASHLYGNGLEFMSSIAAFDRESAQDEVVLAQQWLKKMQ